jgi:hypothetical protein
MTDDLPAAENMKDYVGSREAVKQSVIANALLNRWDGN